MTETLNQVGETTRTLDPNLSPRPDLAAAHEDLNDTPGSISAKVALCLKQGRDWAENRSRRASETVRANPLRSGLGALGVGVVLGMLLRR